MTDRIPVEPAAGVSDHVTHPVVTVRYWAAARAAAGVESEQVAAGTLDEVLAIVQARHPGVQFRNVLATCAVLVGELPVGSRAPHTVTLRAGDSVEFLPPFAGG